MLNEFNAWVRDPAHSQAILNWTTLRDHQLSEPGPSNIIAAHAHDGQNPNWNVPLYDLDIVGPIERRESLTETKNDISKGGLFESKHALEIVVGTYHMHNGVEYAVERSTTDRVSYVCKHRNGCPFLVRATTSNGIWQIIKLRKDHTCQTNFEINAPQQVPAKVLATYFSRKLGEGVVLKPKELIKEAKSEFGIQIDYSFALRVRNLAIEFCYDDYDKSYEMLPSYLHVIRESISGTSVSLQTTHNHLFKYMFLALGPCIAAFKNYLRPVIVVDGTHLKGKNKEILFADVTMDGNEQIFPLAVGIGPIEDDESWTWFLRQVRQTFGSPEDLLIVLDQHKSIKNAVGVVFPEATHRLCFLHLSKNMTAYGQQVVAVMKEPAYCYRDDEFQKKMSLLEAISKDGAYSKLLSIGVHRWSCSQCTTRHFNFMTSNAAECLNARLLLARRLPICSLLEVYRYIVETWFDKHRVETNSRQHVLTEWAMAKLAESVQCERHLTVRGATLDVYRVEEERMCYMVDLHQCTCDCRKFNFDLISCRHAATAIR